MKFTGRMRFSPAARLAQLVERKTLNLVVVGSSPTVGAAFSHQREYQIFS